MGRNEKFNILLSEYIGKMMNDETVQSDKEMFDSLCIFITLAKKNYTANELAESVRMFRDVLNSNYSLDSLIKKESRYQVRNHLSKFLQDISVLWIEAGKE